VRQVGARISKDRMQPKFAMDVASTFLLPTHQKKKRCGFRSPKDGRAC